MSKIYQPNKNNKYWLPHNLYMRTIYFIRDYDRMKADYAEAVENYPAQLSNDGCGGGGCVSDPTYVGFLKVEQLGEGIRAIEGALGDIPSEYRNGIRNNIIYGQRFPDVASRNTWSRNKQRFINYVARNMNWI